MGHILICYSWVKADTRAVIQMHRFQLRSEVLVFSKALWLAQGDTEACRFIGGTCAGPAPSTQKLAGEGGRSFGGVAWPYLLLPGIVGAAWLMADEGAEQWDVRGQFQGLCTWRFRTAPLSGWGALLTLTFCPAPPFLSSPYCVVFAWPVMTMGSRRMPLKDHRGPWHFGAEKMPVISCNPLPMGLPTSS